MAQEGAASGVGNSLSLLELLSTCTTTAQHFACLSPSAHSCEELWRIRCCIPSLYATEHKATIDTDSTALLTAFSSLGAIAQVMDITGGGGGIRPGTPPV